MRKAFVLVFLGSMFASAAYAQDRTLGHVKWYDAEKGIGMIERITGESVFFNKTAFAGSLCPGSGSKVTFQLERNAKGGFNASEILFDGVASCKTPSKPANVSDVRTSPESSGQSGTENSDTNPSSEPAQAEDSTDETDPSSDASEAEEEADESVAEDAEQQSGEPIADADEEASDESAADEAEMSEDVDPELNEAEETEAGQEGEE